MKYRAVTLYKPMSEGGAAIFATLQLEGEPDPAISESWGAMGYGPWIEADSHPLLDTGTCPAPGGCKSCPDPDHCRKSRLKIGLTTPEQEEQDCACMDRCGDVAEEDDHPFALCRFLPRS